MNPGHPHATAPAGNIPFELVVHAIPQHPCAYGGEHRYLSILDVRLRGKYKRVTAALAAIEVEHFGPRVHGDDVGWNILRIDDASPVYFFHQGIQIALGTRIRERYFGQEVLQTLFV